MAHPTPSKTSELASLLNDRSHNPNRYSAQVSINDDHHQPSAFTAVQVSMSWMDLCYEAQLKKGETKKILNGISGHVASGQMLAILGPSGAGKTTMLDILAQRQKGGIVTGDLLMNGHPVNQGVFRRVSAYVQQEDILHGYLTVKETITYAARLRTPETVTRPEIDQKVQLVMKMLGIDHVQDRKIGSEFVRGVSGGEKKRCAIAVELVTNPSLIFLDEPTTGLDTFTAMHLLTILKNLTKIGVTVVFSIHQPRSSIFFLFDTLLLLNGFGEEAFFGPAGEAMPFMQSLGISAIRPDNPADFLLDSVSVVRAAEELNIEDFPFMPPRTQSQDIAAAFRSTKLGPINDQVLAIKKLYAADSLLPEAMSSPYFRSFGTQIIVVSSRSFLNKIRDPVATVVAIIVAIIFATLVGSIYFRLGLEITGQQDRMGVLFFLTMNTAFSNLGSLAMFLFDRSIYVREHRNGMYRPSSYYIGKILQDVPLGICVNFVFSTIAYFMVGLQATAEKFFMFFLICTLVMLNSYTLCMFVSNVAKNYQVANVIAPLILVLFLLPSGFLINLNSIPIIWRWIKYISFFRYGFEALVLNEFDGLTFNCGAIANLTLCQPDGLLFVENQFGFQKSDFNSAIYITAGCCVGYAVLGYICLRLFRTGEGK
ncbi:ABC transporter, putative [Bodo saltans]|uniref:ABC transporter, putative n=1 Tax=Bodo saltans TaxID=75058 RepID=A0A0S4IUY5_BODSA|nr:ABC transporter, putative [Bodo saltans]|eukprot:CUG00176.1 ABC transporter, putative [Bodo saltans]